MVQKESKRRGRPRAYDPETALARATETFWKAGYAGTSLDDLSAAMGMNRPSLYAGFGDKRGLYVKTLERYYDEVRAMVRDALADDPPLRTFMHRFYTAALALYMSGKDGGRGCYSIATAATQAALDPDIRALLVHGVHHLDALFVDRIRLAQDRGEIKRAADPVALAYLASATLHTLAIRSRAGLPRQELEALIAAAIDVVCGRAASRVTQP
jgi:TetR/AcrR family transcriptional regulator, copper-responsive repressor